MSRRMLLFLILWPLMLNVPLLVLLFEARVEKEAKLSGIRKIEIKDPQTAVVALWDREEAAFDKCLRTKGYFLFRDILHPNKFQEWVNYNRYIIRRELKNVEVIGLNRWKVHAVLYPEQGEPIHVAYIVTKEGGTFLIEEIHERCGVCNGRGWVKCAVCGGTGQVKERVINEYGFYSYKSVPCSECGGTGRKRCEACEGRGYIERFPLDYVFYYHEEIVP